MKGSRREKGTGCLFKRGWKFVYQYTDIDGKVKSKTLRSEDGKPITVKADAEKAAARIYAEMQQLQQLSNRIDYLNKVAEVKKLITQKEIKLSALWQYYLRQPNRPDSGDVTLLGYERSVKQFLEYCGKKRIKSIEAVTENVAGDYMVHLWSDGISARTYNKHLQALKLVFRTCLQDDSPFQYLKPKQVETESRRAFTPEQVNAIFQKLEEPDFHLLYKDEMRIVLMLGLAFGLRLHDATCFKWSYIEGNLARFKPAKTKRKLHQDLLLPIPTILQEQFKLAEAWKIDDYVLPHVAKRYQTNSSGISQDINRLLEASGIQTRDEAPEGVRRQNYVNTQGEKCVRHIGRYSFHSFRHTFCSIAANAGKDLSVIRSIVGHTNIAMTEHYTHFDLESKRQVIASLPLPGVPGTESVMWESQLPQCTQQQLAHLGKWLDEHLSGEEKRQLQTLI